MDLAACSASIERPRNRVYQLWLLKRLVRQTLADPFGVSADEEAKLQATPPRSIREFDSAVTAPRWGFAGHRQSTASAAQTTEPPAAPAAGGYPRRGPSLLAQSQIFEFHQEIAEHLLGIAEQHRGCLLYTSPSPRDRQKSRMPSSA